MPKPKSYDGPTNKTSFNFPEPLLKEFRMRCLELDNKAQSVAFIEAVTVWLAATEYQRLVVPENICGGLEDSQPVVRREAAAHFVEVLGIGDIALFGPVRAHQEQVPIAILGQAAIDDPALAVNFFRES